MPYDPNKPAANSPNSSAEMRGQLNGLHDLITAIMQIVAAQIDGVITLNPGDPASATVSVIGDTLHFTLSIPRGDEGLPGLPGIDGAVGPPFAQAIVDAVNTLAPGSSATVSVSFDGTNVHLTFGIPAGDTGGQGIQGNPGIDGAPGEVTNAQLASAVSAAVSGTSNNTNAVPTMDTAFANDPPTLADLEIMRAAYNNLVLAARR